MYTGNLYKHNNPKYSQAKLGRSHFGQRRKLGNGVLDFQSEYGQYRGSPESGDSWDMGKSS